jgi:hypothetical protein
MLWFLKIFLPKLLAKNGVFVKNTASISKNGSLIFLEKRNFFRPK